MLKNNIFVNNFITDNSNLINTKEAIRYLGYNDGISSSELPDEDMMLNLRMAEQELVKVIDPRYVYKETEILTIDGYIILDTFKIKLTGKSINEYLKKCDKAIICCATLSAQVDCLIDRYQNEDMLMALLIDASANAAIENLRKFIEDELKKKYQKNVVKSMFGFGYGDLDIRTIPFVLKNLNTMENIGITCNESCILTPLKSVCGIIGITDNKIYDKNKCSNSCTGCNMKDNCQYKKNGNV